MQHICEPTAKGVRQVEKNVITRTKKKLFQSRITTQNVWIACLKAHLIIVITVITIGRARKAANKSLLNRKKKKLKNYLRKLFRKKRKSGKVKIKVFFKAKITGKS